MAPGTPAQTTSGLVDGAVPGGDDAGSALGPGAAPARRLPARKRKPPVSANGIPSDLESPF
jgi:hypothetical protein